jgi:hypothetical protein
VDEELPSVADRDEILIHLTKAARKGNVPAMRLLLEELRHDGESSKQATSVIDELANKRRSAG